jgi:outer membrane protein assembly factor BamB
VEASPAAYREKARAKAVAGKCWNHAAVANGRIYARSTTEAVCLDVSGRISAR